MCVLYSHGIAAGDYLPVRRRAILASGVNHERRSKTPAAEQKCDTELMELAIPQQCSSAGNGRRQAVSSRPIVG